MDDSKIRQLNTDGNSQDSHQLGADSDAELGLHHEAVQTAADTDDDVTQGLSTEVDDPA